MKLNNDELFSTLVTLSGKQGERQIGLLHEDISLGLKRKLQKIQKEALELYNEYDKNKKEINEKFKDDPDNLKKELEILDKETVDINQEMVDISFIEQIVSDYNYDFNVIEKFAEEKVK